MAVGQALGKAPKVENGIVQDRRPTDDDYLRSKRLGLSKMEDFVRKT